MEGGVDKKTWSHVCGSSSSYAEVWQDRSKSAER